jgi:hypothetical protein
MAVFHNPDGPNISIAEYIKRIAWFHDCPKECFVLALEYIDRATKCKPEIQVNYNTAHLLLLTSIKIATKLFSDMGFNSTFYAKVVGLPVATVSALEIKLLFFLRFNLFVFPEQYLSRYEKMLADNQGLNKVIINSS